jgi:uncharacterized protein YjcR
MARTTADAWMERVEKWAQSGKTAKDFADEVGCNANTLTTMRWKLVKAGRVKTASQRRGALRSRKDHGNGKGGGSKRRARPSGGELSGAEPLLELQVGNVVVRVPAGFDMAKLELVLRAVRGAA